MLKKILKLLALLAGLGLVAGAVFLTNLIWFRPWSLNLFYEKIFLEQALRSPEMLTSIGLAEQFGYRAHNAHLSDASVAREREDLARTRSNLADLKAYDLSRQTPAQRLSTRTLAWFLETSVEGERFAFHDYPVNQLFGVQNNLPDFMANLHRVPDETGARHYVSRLSEWGRKFDQVIAGLEHRARLGVIPPRFVLQRVLTEMRGFTARPAKENLLHTTFARKLAEAKGISAERQAAFLAEAEAAITGTVYPAYQRLIACVEGLASRATTDDGVWKLPEGDAFYAHQLRSYTTTSLTPAEIHAIGLREITRIEGEMRAILDAQGHTGGTRRPGCCG